MIDAKTKQTSLSLICCEIPDLFRQIVHVAEAKDKVTSYRFHSLFPIPIGFYKQNKLETRGRVVGTFYLPYFPSYSMRMFISILIFWQSIEFIAGILAT